jgi:hypothetical protein
VDGFDTTKTLDYSPLVIHFVKSTTFVRPDLIASSHPVYAHRQATASDRLLSILKSKTIHATPMPFLPRNAQAVCFTECVWDALKRFASRYSQYGVVFAKSLIHAKGGGPALYVRGDVLKGLGSNLPDKIEPFVVPFDPGAVLKAGVRLDWLVEREWRLPSSLSFEYHDIEYVIVWTINDATRIVSVIGSQHIPMEKVIPMETYETIKKSWGGN